MNERYKWMNYKTWDESPIDFPKLTKIHLENFKAIKGPTDINFSDITFLVGPNSVGKSAIHDAIKFFQHFLDNGYGGKYNPETMARCYDRSELDEDESKLCCVGIEIEIGEAHGQYIEHRYWEADDNDQDSLPSPIIDFLNDFSGRVELRLTFYKNDGKDFTSHGPKNKTKLELFKDGKDSPFLVIGKRDSLNYFDIQPHDEKEIDELDPSDMVSGLFSDSVCEIDINDKLGNSLTTIESNERSPLDNHVCSIRNGYFIHRGVYWNPGIKKRDRIVTFEYNQDFKYRDDKIKNQNFSELDSKSRTRVYKINIFIGLLIDLFRSALHISHVPANRPIIDSHEALNIMDEADWYEANFNSFNIIVRPHYPDYPGGHLPKLIKEPDARSSFKGYEHAITEYAWRNICKENDNDKEQKYKNLSEDVAFYFGLPKSWRDFPNLALKKYLRSWVLKSKNQDGGVLPRYEVKVESNEITPHWTNKEASASGYNLTRFRVYDSELERTCDFSDLGSGVSFVFPILVSLGEADMSFIEQPELHLHPKAQAEIGDVLLAAKAENRRSIVETHSEQTILRISQRIKETSPLPEDILPIMPELQVKADAIRIYYFEQSKNQNDGTEIHELKLAPDGSLLDAWPNDFFDKDDIHAFSRLDLFSDKAKADLKNVEKKWPWINRLTDPDIRRWFLCASYSTTIDFLYPVVFPLYTAKIIEKLIVDKFLDPFKEKHKLGNRERLEELKIILDYLDERPKYRYYECRTCGHIVQKWMKKCPECEALKTFEIKEGKVQAPTLGQFLHLLKAINENWINDSDKKRKMKVRDIKLCKEFGNFFESLPEEKKELFNNENYIQLEELQKIRGGSAHLDDPDTISVNDIKTFLINEEENPGILLRAFGFFPESHDR